MPEPLTMYALLAVDAEGFSRNAGTHMPVLNTTIKGVLGEACARSDLAQTWHKARFVQSEGDGYVALLPYQATQMLVAPFLDRLHDVLAEEDVALREYGRDVRLRLRLALHYGLARGDGSDADATGPAMVEVHRILEATPLKAALHRSSPDVTFMAAAISDDVYRNYVLHHHTGLPPEVFTEIQAQVKTYDRPAWLYVPRPSMATDATADEPQPAATEPQNEAREGFSINTGQVFSGTTRIGGDAINKPGNVRLDRI